MRIILLRIAPIKYPDIPLTFVRSGNVNVNEGSVYGIGNNGYDWSRIASSYTRAHYLYVYPTGVNPSYANFYRWYGFPLRCLYSGGA